MPTHTFDSLLHSLSSSVNETKHSISDRQQGQMRRIYTDDQGKSLTWTFYVPSDQGEKYKPLELPLVSLRSNSELHVSSLSIELNVDVNETSKSKRLSVTLRRFKNSLTSTFVRLKIIISGIKNVEGTVLANGKLLKKFNGNNS